MQMLLELTGGAFTFVEEGTANADNGFVLTTNGTPTLGTTNITFEQFSGAGQISAGAGLTKTGNTIDVVGTAIRLLYLLTHLQSHQLMLDSHPLPL